MPLLAGDIRLARSANMADVPEGGGPPSAQLLTSGRSNEIFPDISEETRTVGRVEIYQIFGILRNTDRAALMGSNVILAQPPADPNVSITLLSLKDPFATRADIAKRIEAGMSPGPEWSGYLRENHYQTMRSITLLQRPGLSPPTIGRTYLLIWNEGLAGERRQRVRIKTTDTQNVICTEIVNGQLIDFLAQVTTCELFDPLQYDFPGSPPSRQFARAAGQTVVRETVYSDTGMFCGASRLTEPTQVNDSWLQLATIYSQIVPNSRSETALVDQRPMARQTLVLATAPRRVEVGTTPHSKRIKIGEENVGLVYVDQLRPLPAPGMTYIDYWALGTRYTITDDGTGRLTGAGGGVVDPLTGAINYTLKALPDIGSSITISWGSRVGYTDRSQQAGAVRMPEFPFILEGDADADQALPNSLTFKWLSGGVLRTATDNGTGQITGAATGVIDYPTRTGVLRPSYMPDPGAQIEVDYTVDNVVTEIYSGVGPTSPDVAGFVTLPLAQQPAAGSLAVSWATICSVSVTSGGQPATSSPSWPITTGTDIVANTVPDTQVAVLPMVMPQAWAGPPNIIPPSTYVNWPRSS